MSVRSHPLSRFFMKSRGVLVPSILFLLFVIVSLISFRTGSPMYKSLTRMMIQWDGLHYLSIARDGYEHHPCGHLRNAMCGNVGWFPMYPMLGATVAWIGLDQRYIMIGLSWLMLWLSLLVLYRLVALKYDYRIAFVALIALLIYPGAFYYLTSFPYATLLLLSTVVFYLLETRRLRWLWLPTAMLAVTYPSGAMIGLPILYMTVAKWRQLVTRDREYLVVAMLSIPVAILVYFGYYWYAFDDFWLYVHFQSQSFFAHEPSFPLWVIYRSLSSLPFGGPINASLTLAILSAAVFYTRRLPGTWQWFLFGILLFTPTMGTTVCYYRHIVVAWPLAVMIALACDSSQRRWLLPLYVVAAIYVNWWLLLPAYKTGTLM